jgi:hypothetical protein
MWVIEERQSAIQLCLPVQCPARRAVTTTESLHVSRRMVVFSKHQFLREEPWRRKLRLLRRGEFGDGLGALRHGVLGELAREDEAHGSLDLAGGDGGLLGVAGQLGGLGGNLLKLVLDEGVEDADGLAGNAGVRVDLLQDLVDVDLPALCACVIGVQRWGFQPPGSPTRGVVKIVTDKHLHWVLIRVQVRHNGMISKGRSPFFLPPFLAGFTLFTAAGFFSAGFFSPLGAMTAGSWLR